MCFLIIYLTMALVVGYWYYTAPLGIEIPGVGFINLEEVDP